MRKRVFIPLFLTLILGTFLLPSCNVSESKPTVTSVGLPPTPEYMLNHGPNIPEVPLDTYLNTFDSPLTFARGVSVSFFVGDTGIAPENWKLDIIANRVTLYVDDEKITDETLKIIEDGEMNSGLYRLSWTPKLSVGPHNFRVEIINDEDEILEYEWGITITK